MTYRIRYAKSVLKTLDRMSPDVRRRVCAKIDRMTIDLSGDVKRLTDFSPEYRLRVGDWRVLFNVEGDTISMKRYDIAPRHPEDRACSRSSQSTSQSTASGSSWC